MHMCEVTAAAERPTGIGSRDDIGTRRRGEDEAEVSARVVAIRADPRLTARQRQALLEIYDAFAARSTRRRKSQR
jgi:hypothetical protein